MSDEKKEYSPLPWRYELEDDSGCSLFCIRDADGFKVCGGLDQEDAARIVAAVNFCEGVNNLANYLPLKTMLQNHRKRCDENTMFEAHLEAEKIISNRLRAELAQKQKEIEGLRAELSATTSSAP
jgi:hypothetical protein